MLTQSLLAVLPRQDLRTIVALIYLRLTSYATQVPTLLPLVKSLVALFMTWLTEVTVTKIWRKAFQIQQFPVSSAALPAIMFYSGGKFKHGVTGVVIPIYSGQVVGTRICQLIANVYLISPLLSVPCYLCTPSQILNMSLYLRFCRDLHYTHISTYVDGRCRHQSS